MQLFFSLLLTQFFLSKGKMPPNGGVEWHVYAQCQIFNVALSKTNRHSIRRIQEQYFSIPLPFRLPLLHLVILMNVESPCSYIHTLSFKEWKLNQLFHGSFWIINTCISMLRWNRLLAAFLLEPKDESSPEESINHLCSYVSVLCQCGCVTEGGRQNADGSGLVFLGSSTSETSKIKLRCMRTHMTNFFTLWN